MPCTLLCGSSGSAATVEKMLRNSADAYASESTPTGCMIVLAAVNTSTANDRVRELLAASRCNSIKNVEQRIRRGIDEGDVPEGTDAAAQAGYVSAVLQGISIQSRDGASADQLHRIIDSAMTAWDALTGVAVLANRGGRIASSRHVSS